MGATNDFNRLKRTIDPNRECRRNGENVKLHLSRGDCSPVNIANDSHHYASFRGSFVLTH
jgi:hypothetical protein